MEILEQRTGFRAVQISSVKGSIAMACLNPRATIGRSYLNVVSGDAADWRKGRVSHFALYDDRWVTAIVVPHWLAASISAALAVIPWTSQKWSFSLRTLLIAITLIAVVLGVAVWTIR